MNIHILPGDGTRIVLFEEGGYCTERYVDAIGWVLDDDPPPSEPLIAAAAKLLAVIHLQPKS